LSIEKILVKKKRSFVNREKFNQENIWVFSKDESLIKKNKFLSRKKSLAKKRYKFTKR